MCHGAAVVAVVIGVAVAVILMVVAGTFACLRVAVVAAGVIVLVLSGDSGVVVILIVGGASEVQQLETCKQNRSRMPRVVSQMFWLFLGFLCSFKN